MNDPMTAGQLAQMYHVLRQQGCERVDIDIFLNNGVFADFAKAGAKGKLKDRQFLKRYLQVDSFTLSVEYHLTFREMIDLANFQVVVDDITDDLVTIPPAKIVVRCEAELIHLNDEFTSQGAKNFVPEGYRPARVEELLTFAKMYPEFQLSFEIVALGTEVQTSVEGEEGIYLFLLGGEPANGLDNPYRLLKLEHVDVDWPADTRFLVVRN